MGSQASQGVRARQRATAARIERLISRREARAPIGSERRDRIRAALRETSRALRDADAAQAVARAAETQAGAALALVVADGLTQREACEALALSPRVGRRLIRSAETTTPDVRPGLSTPSTSGSAPGARPDDGETGTPAWPSRDALKEGKS